MSQIVPRKSILPLALALASGVSAAKAADEAGVCLKTVYRRLRKPAFRKLVAELRGRLIETALGRLANNMTRASDIMTELLNVEDPAIRLRSARALLQFGIKLRDSVDLSERINVLECELQMKVSGAR